LILYGLPGKPERQRRLRRLHCMSRNALQRAKEIDLVMIKAQLSPALESDARPGYT
jgi:hypothetical protein